MKKITLLFCLLAVSFGYSQQVILEDFEGTAPSTQLFDGFTSATVVANPTNAAEQSLELITSASGQSWQGAKLTIQNTTIDMTTADKTMSVDIYSLTARDFLFKLVDGDVGGTDNNQESKTAASHTGSGWETLSLDFNVAADTGQPGYNPPNDKFGGIVFFPLYIAPNNGWNAAAMTTTYIDNVTGISGGIAETCSDGIMNNGETEVDCGGPNCDACDPVPPGPATTPTTPDNQVISIYGDTGSYSNVWTPDYSFGATQGELDLGSGSVNNALKMDFSDQGYGQGTNNTVDISEYEWVHLDYYAPNVAAGVNGHEFKMILIGQGEGEKDYIFKDDGSGDGTIVFDAWQSIDIPLSHFTALGLTLPNYLQYKLGSTSDLNTTVVYFDNIYIWSNEAVLSTESFQTTEFRAYPNPTSGNWNISGKSIITSVAVYDILGKQVIAIAPNSNEAAIDASSLNSGIYFARIDGVNGSKTIKLIKE